MSRGKHMMFFAYEPLLLLLLILPHHTTKSETQSDCASSCGNLHGITYPFRLTTDPKHCGQKSYELVCEDNTAVLYLYKKAYYGRYLVQAINYNNLTIRLVHPNVKKDNCSLPNYSLGQGVPYYERLSYWKGSEYMFPGDETAYIRVNYLAENYHEPLNTDLVFMKCEKPVISPFYLDISTCGKRDHNLSSSSHGEKYSYVKVGSTNASDLVDLCRIELIAWTSLLPKNISKASYMDVRNSLAYGFELSWAPACCGNSKKQPCNDTTAVPNFYCYGYNMRIYLLASLGSYFTVFLALYHGVISCCGCPCVMTFLIYKWRKRHLSMYDGVEEFLERHQDHLMPIRYSYSDIKKITKGFKDKLGEGGYGSVYKAKLRSGRFAAVKMLSKPKANGQDFINEVATIGRIHHVNVVHLVGFCAERSKRALVYEFMPNGSLDKYIFSQEGSLTISNEKMYEIALGVAYGIEYLHRGCDMQILHFDIKPHNILLDEKFVPKISDFGLAKLYATGNSIVSLTAARGTMGYMAPELLYKNIGGISYKADVYSFGMLLMEMVGRRKNLNAFTEHSSRIYFPSWAYDQVSEGKDIKVEATTKEESKIIKKMMMVALWCIQLKPADRPSMHRVKEMLEGEVEFLEMPPKPFVSPQLMEEDEGRIKKNPIMGPSHQAHPDPVDHRSDSIIVITDEN